MNAGSPTRINDVLIRDGEEITLLDSEFVIGRSDTLHVLDNLYVGQVSGRKNLATQHRTLIALCPLSEVNIIFTQPARLFASINYVSNDAKRKTSHMPAFHPIVSVFHTSCGSAHAAPAPR